MMLAGWDRVRSSIFGDSVPQKDLCQWVTKFHWKMELLHVINLMLEPHSPVD